MPKLFFSPEFALSFSNAFEAGIKNKEHHFKYKKTFTLNQGDIQSILTSDQGKLDYHRIALSFPTQAGTEPVDIYRWENTQKAAEKSNISLSKTEYDALMAASCFTGSTISQGGLPQLPFIASYYWILFSFGLNVSLLTQSHRTLTRDKQGFHLSVSHAPSPSLDVLGLKNKAAADAKYHFTVTENNGEFTVQIQDDYEFNITDELYQDHLLPVIEARLQQGRLTEQDLFMIIPCLFDTTLADLFFYKLLNENEHKLLEKANHLIRLACKDKPEEFKRLMDTKARMASCKDKPEEFKRLMDAKACMALRKECIEFEAYLQHEIPKKLKEIPTLQKPFRQKIELLSTQGAYEKILEMIAALPKNPKETEDFKDLTNTIHQLKALQALKAPLKREGSSSEKLKEFIATFEANKSSFTSGDNRAKQFLAKIGEILLGIVTLGWYAIKRAKELRTSTWYFFQPRSETFEEVTMEKAGLKKRSSLRFLGISSD